ncbi:unnamed protein product [Staurois parvus]|uniref:Uncharacterized protein n=1 Tax=Staurois parvus TaxID=386267 RepID=A0ABN9E9W7_9NEOB|nr:unnamed protein product [Staurois parvus]
MVGVTSQGSGAGERSDKARDQSRVSNESDKNREQEQDTGPRRNTHQGRVCRSGHPLNTPV